MSGVTRTRKRVVIAEGERDTTFLKTLVNRHGVGRVGDTVDIGSEPHDALHRRESNELAKFAAVGHRDVLVKSEGGRENVVRVFPRLVGDLRQIDVELTLLFDLDGDGLSTVVDDVNERLDGRTPGRETRLVPSSDPDRYHHLIAREFSLAVGDRHVVDVTLAAFHESLETVAGIDKERDSRDEMDEKARRLVDDERVRKPVVEAVF
jgi:hypothetical protein